MFSVNNVEKENGEDCENTDDSSKSRTTQGHGMPDNSEEGWFPCDQWDDEAASEEYLVGHVNTRQRVVRTNIKDNEDFKRILMEYENVNDTSNGEEEDIEVICQRYEYA